LHVLIIKEEELLSDESEKVLQWESIIYSNEKTSPFVSIHTEQYCSGAYTY
jgi:hypothetical protein